MFAVAAGVERRGVRRDGGGDGARMDDDAGQRRPRGEGEAGSQAQGPETTCGAQEVRCLLLLCLAVRLFRAAPFPPLLYVSGS